MRARFHVCQFAKRGEHGGHGTFCVAGAAPVQPAVFPARNKLRIVGADGVEVRREQDGLADFTRRQQPGDDIGTSGQNLLEFDIESGAGSDRCQKIRNTFFTGERM